MAISQLYTLREKLYETACILIRYTCKGEHVKKKIFELDVNLTKKRPVVRL